MPMIENSPMPSAYGLTEPRACHSAGTPRSGPPSVAERHASKSFSWLTAMISAMPIVKPSIRLGDERDEPAGAEQPANHQDHARHQRREQQPVEPMVLVRRRRPR